MEGDLIVQGKAEAATLAAQLISSARALEPQLVQRAAQTEGNARVPEETIADL